MTACAATIAVPALLDQVGRECADLAADIEKLQDTLSELLSRVDLTPELMERAQSLDYVFQHVAQLAGVASRAADQASPDWRVCAGSVLSGVSLAGLSGRLAGGAPPEPAEDAVAAHDDLELF